MNYEAKFLGREKLAGDVAIFRFEKPEGFRFTAGQWCFLSVPPSGHQDDKGLRRPLSIASSPLEKELIFATKLSDSAMKRTMAEMAPGTSVVFGQAMGTMVLPEKGVPPLVFLAGASALPLSDLCASMQPARERIMPSRSSIRAEHLKKRRFSTICSAWQNSTAAFRSLSR